MRYLIGIDLGTTKCALSYVDLDRQQNPNLAVKTFRLPQMTADGRIVETESLFSCCYLLPVEEAGKHQLAGTLPKNYLVGQLAFEKGAKVPTRLVQSAKSWLCHSHAMRNTDLLPVDACEITGRISPVEASSRYLRYFLEVWNNSIAKGDPEKAFEVQDIVLTIPASFDEVARALTVEAAKKAGFTQYTLLEEPQAAFYHWISSHEKTLSQQVKPGSLILIVDIGGGTSDFSLIAVKETEVGLSFDRVAVGEHLLLGGDNMDEALAHLMESRFNSSIQWAQLKRQAKLAKETLLADNAPPSFKAVLLGKGSSVVQGSQSAELFREEATECLLNGFFGQYPWNEACQLPKKSGLKPLGLPYEEEPSITKHLAAFLKRTGQKPDYVLFNGSALKPKRFRQAICQSLKNWFNDKEIVELSTSSLELAVAKGAAHFGKVKQGLAKRIGGGAARSYYAEVDQEGQAKALTLIERGAVDGTSFKPTNTFHLLPNSPVAFKIYTSHTRLTDHFGDLVDIDPLEMQALPELHTVLRFGSTKEKVPVLLEAKLNDIGVLELALNSKNTEHRWLLEFQVRQAQDLTEKKARTDVTLESKELDKAKEAIACYFENPPEKKNLMEILEEVTQLERSHWPASYLRAFFDNVIKSAPLRNKSLKLEERFWNALGYFLRPGNGFPLDDFRIKETWKIILADLNVKKTDEILLQKWICYRRLSGGLSKGQQLRLCQDLMEGLPLKGKTVQNLKSGQEAYFYSERIRALASMEWLEVSQKLKLGEAILQRILTKQAQAADFYALGRIGARKLLQAPFTHTVPKDIAESWLQKLLTLQPFNEALFEPLAAQLACFTSYRELNISKELKETILARFPADQYSRLHVRLLQETAFSHEEQEALLADKLPLGLSLK